MSRPSIYNESVGSTNIFHGDNNWVGVRVGDDQRTVRRNAFLENYMWRDKTPIYDYRTFGLARVQEIIQNYDFRRCFSNKGFTFILQGKHGVGKSATISYLSRYMYKSGDSYGLIAPTKDTDWHEQRSVLRAPSVFLILNDPLQNNVSILLSFIAQLCHVTSQSDGLLDKTIEMSGFNIQTSRHDNQLSAEDVSELLAHIILESRRPTCLFVDALDEYDEKARPDLLRLLVAIQSKTEVGLVLSSRIGILDWNHYFKQHCKLHDLLADTTDIESHIRRKLRDFEAKWARDPEHCQKVVDTIVKASSGSFLLAKLNLSYLDQRGGPTGHQLEKDLNTIRSTLRYSSDSGDKYVTIFAEEYHRNIARIQRQENFDQRTRAMLTMGAMRDAFRPLSKRELIEMHRICVDGSRPDLLEALEWEDITSSCCGLVDVDGLSNVSFTHASLLEYLWSPMGQDQIPNRHHAIGKKCVAYLTLGSCNGKVCTDSLLLKIRTDKWPFLDYAARYWQSHLQNTSEGSGLDTFYRFAMMFLSNNSNVECAVQITMFEDRAHIIPLRLASDLSQDARGSILILREDFQRHVVDPFAPNLATGLHLACELGLKELVNRLLPAGDPMADKQMLSRQDSMNHTPLHLAVLSGQTSIVENLLEAGAPCDLVNNFNINAFHLALRLKRYEIAKVIMNKSANQAELVNTASTGSNRVSLAYGELRIRFLQEVLIPQETEFSVAVHGRTALMTAAQNGDIHIMRTLLSVPGVEKYASDSAGEQCLHRAAKKGHLEVVKLLVGEGLEPSDPVRHGYLGGYNALHLASAYERSRDVVAWLMKHNRALCFRKGSDDRTPLHTAAIRGIAMNIEAMLLHFDSSTITTPINMTDDEGDTALHLAVAIGSLMCVQPLLNQHGVDIEVRNNAKFTPLQLAVKLRVSGCIGELLKRTEQSVLQEDHKLLVMAAESNDMTTFQTVWTVDHVSRSGISKAYPALKAKGVSEEILKVIREWPIEKKRKERALTGTGIQF